MNQTAVLTDHCIERGKERLNLASAPLLKLANKALEKGKGQGGFKGAFRRYLDCKGIQNRSRMIVCDRAIFAFKPDGDKMVAITVYPIPQEFRKAAKQRPARGQQP